MSGTLTAKRHAARTRWDRDAIAKGQPPGPRVVRLDQLDATTRGIITAILSARANASTSKAPAVSETPAEALEVRRAAGEPSAA